MRRLFFALLIIIQLPAAQSASDLVNGIAVVVNEAVITEQDLQNYTRPAIELLARQYGRDPQRFQQELMKTRSDAVEQLVEEQLILHEFKTAGYQPLPDAIIEDEIKKRIRERYGDRVTLTKTLQAQGMTAESYRKAIREQIIIEVLRRKHVTPDITISPHKIEMFYITNREAFKLGDQIKLRMIVLNHTTEAQAESAKKIIAEIRQKLEEGTAFSEMASVYSEGSQRAQGGDWGWVEKSVLRKDLADVAFTLPPGKPSETIVTPTASYLMLVEEVRPNHVRPLPDVRNEIEKTLLAQERTRLHKKWIDRLRTKSFVRYF